MAAVSGDVVVTHRRQFATSPIVRQTASDLGITTKKPKFPHYALVDKRIESFLGSNTPVSVEALVEAGLFYTGVGDNVRCYYCGGGLRNMETGDDPMVEHARWYLNCPHVNLVKGKDFVNRIADGLPPEPDVHRVSQNDNSGILDSVAARTILEMGYSPDTVWTAIHILKDRKGGMTGCKNYFAQFTAVELLDIIIEMEESGQIGDYSGNEDDMSYSDNQVGEDEGRSIAELRAENERLKERMTCKVCMEKTADLLFLPCGHLLFCGHCGIHSAFCSQCGTQIRGKMKVCHAGLAQVNYHSS